MQRTHQALKSLFRTQVVCCTDKKRNFIIRSMKIVSVTEEENALKGMSTNSPCSLLSRLLFFIEFHVSSLVSDEI